MPYWEITQPGGGGEIWSCSGGGAAAVAPGGYVSWSCSGGGAAAAGSWKTRCNAGVAAAAGGAAAAAAAAGCAACRWFTSAPARLALIIGSINFN